MLGICLGAQLIAHAGGAKVYPNVKPPAKPDEQPAPAPEIGWGPVSFPFPGNTEPVVMGLMDNAPMFHWHFDTFDLPKLPPPPTGNVLISSTRACRNQAFRFKTRIFGFQYHFEMTPEGIEAMLQSARDDWMKVLGPDGDKKIREDTARHYDRYERLGNRILQNFVQYLRLY